MKSPVLIAEKFNAIDAHDDTLESFLVNPARGRRRKASVEVTLFRHWENKRRAITFIDTANVELVVDATVLYDNCPSNTAGLSATTDMKELESVIRRHKKTWNVRYDKSLDPTPAKFLSISNLVLFKVRLFGGTALILARSFNIKSTAQSDSG